MTVNEVEETEDGPGLFRRPIWLTNEQLDWLDDQVRRKRSEERGAGGPVTQISRSSVIREWIDGEIAA